MSEDWMMPGPVVCKSKPRLPLHRLPTGEWIELALLTRIWVVEYGVPCVAFHIDSAIQTKSVPFETVAQAQEYADTLGALVNEARARP